MPSITFFLQSKTANGRFSEYIPGEEVADCLTLVSKIILKPAVLDLLVPAYECQPKAEQDRDGSKNSKASITRQLTENPIVVRLNTLSGSTGDFGRTSLDPGMRHPTIYVNEKLVIEIDKEHNTLLCFVLIVLLLHELNHFIGMCAHPGEVTPPSVHAADQYTILGFAGGKPQVAGESGYAFEEAFLGGILTLLFENDEAAKSYGNIRSVAFVRSKVPVTPAQYLAQEELSPDDEGAQPTTSQRSDEAPEEDVVVEKRPDKGKGKGKGREHKKEPDKGGKGHGEHEEEDNINESNADKPLETREPSGDNVGEGTELQLDTRVLLDSETDIGVIIHRLQTGKFKLPLLHHKTLLPIEGSPYADHTRFSWHVLTK